MLSESEFEEEEGKTEEEKIYSCPSWLNWAARLLLFFFFSYTGYSRKKQKQSHTKEPKENKRNVIG